MRRKDRNEKTRKFRARRSRVRKSIARSERNSLVIFRSSKHMYAQLVDPSGKTITTVSTRSKDVRGDTANTGNIEAAKLVGTAIAKAAQAHDIGEVVFNRNGFLYHGRVKALAEAAREAGLSF